MSLCLGLFTILFMGANGFGTNNGKCERITSEIPMCMDMRYNLTKMPNIVGHTSQKEANNEIREYLPLVQINCSPLLKFFLCSVYAPMCTEQVDEVLIIPACRSMCEDVKSKCEPVLNKVDLEWPESLRCERLPVKSDMSGELCMEAPSSDDVDMKDFGENIPGYNPQIQNNWERILDALQQDQGFLVSSTSKPSTPQTRATQCPDRFVYVDSLGENSTSACTPRCNIDVYFRQEDKRFAEVWMTVWASLCLVSTLLTILTFIQDTSRFTYPERPIIFLAMCYAMYASAYIIRAITGPTAISCDVTIQGEAFLIQEGLESTWCTIIFLITYYFGMASCLWWVILTIAWFLAAGRKWGSEAIQRRSSYFHLAAWAIPAIKTIFILVRRRVDGDQLTGMCYVGNQDPTSLLIFVIIPLIVYLVTGSVFILAGFLALLRIRGELKGDSTNMNVKKLEKLMAKIGIFAVLFTVPGVSLVVCLIYEYRNMTQWREVAMETPCHITHTEGQGKTLDCSLNSSVPTIELFLLKIFMSLAVGITSGMWIWSKKTLQSWSTVCNRMRGTPHRKVLTPQPQSTVSMHGVTTSLTQPPQQVRPGTKHLYAYQKCAIVPPPAMSSQPSARSHEKSAELTQLTHPIV